MVLTLASCRAAPTPTAPAAPALAVEGVLTYQRDGNVYVLPLDTKVDRKLTDFPPVSPAAFSARSPDGARLAYVRVEGLGSTMWVGNADGSGAQKILDEVAGGATLEYPQWTPDGTGIVYAYHGFLIEGGAIKGEVFRAERVDPDGSNRTVLAPDAESPTLAPDGALAFVRTTRAGQQLVLRTPDGSERVLVGERTFLVVAAPRFSPDGQRIAFAAAGDGPKVGSGSPPGEASPGPAASGRGALGALLRLGASIAYAHGDPRSIWLVDRGGALRRVSNLAEDEPTVAWGEGGQYLAVNGATGVYIVDVASGQFTQLSKTGGYGGIDWTR